MPYKKSTDIWTSLKDWQSAEKIGKGTYPGRCNDGMCRQGMRKSNGHWNHKESIGGPAKLQLKGPNVKKMLWRLPQLLTHEFTEQLRQTQTNSDQKIVIDFFLRGRKLEGSSRGSGIYLPACGHQKIYNANNHQCSSLETISLVVHCQ